MSVSLYRKYRPQDFASVVGQKAAVDVLTNAITKGLVGHAYLFSGSRGCGKTSIARIFAKALNCLDPQGYEPCGKCANCQAITAGESLDVIEIDGASNNGVENIRGLRENITLAPFSSSHKIYIIDEVHMLSQGAFNALLKTLEEPPEHVIFIMATTEPHKVPVTIRSRCQHIPFHSISPEDIYSRLEYVCQAEGVSAESEALWEISRQAEGALRDALSLLEQVIASGEVSLVNVEAVLGAGSRPAFERWLKTLRTGTQEGYTALKAMIDAGASGVRVFEEMFSLVRNLWLVCKWKGIAESLGLSNAEKKFLLEEAANWRVDEVHRLLTNILRALTKARQGVKSDILLGMFMLSLEGNDLGPDPSRGEHVSDLSPSSSPYAWEGSRVLTPTPDLTQERGSTPPAPHYDSALKNELLTIAHGVDFVIYCALFNVNAFVDSNTLFLDVIHPYCYNLLTITANTDQLARMFTKYGKVILRHGEKITECRAIENVVDQSMNNQVQSSPEPEPEPEPELEPVIPETVPYVHEVSAFDEYRRQLASLGASPEVILRRRIENSDDTEDSEDENITQEGDSEE